MPVLGKWLVRIENTVIVDAADAEQAKEEALSRRFIPVSREVVAAVPRYGGVIDDGPPPKFPGYSLCRACLGPHWTRDHDRAWQAIADQTKKGALVTDPRYTVILEYDRRYGGYTASVTMPDNAGFVTQGKTLDEAFAMAKEAATLYLEDEADND